MAGVRGEQNNISDQDGILSRKRRKEKNAEIRNFDGGQKIAQNFDGNKRGKEKCTERTDNFDRNKDAKKRENSFDRTGDEKNMKQRISTKTVH